MTPSRSRSVRHELVRLGWPVLIAQVAIMLYGVIDTVMAGRYGTTDLAAVGIASSIYVSIFVTLTGVLLALSPIAAQHFGAGRNTAIGEEVRQAIWVGVVLTAIAVLAVRHPEPFLAITRVAPEVEEKIRAYLAAIAWGVPALLLFRVFHSFSTAISRARAVMVLNLLGLALKIPLNLVFMYGYLGLPELGSQGLAVATTVASWVTCLLGWGLCRFDSSYAPFGVFARFSWPRWRPIRHLLAVGVPIGVTFLVDVTAFTFMTLFIARLGTTESGAHQIAANFAALLFMLPLALGSAAGILVGQAIGAGDYSRARATGLAAVRIGGALACLICMTVLALREVIADLYASDPAVRTIAAGLLGLVAAYHIFDSMQAVAVNVLRGYKRTVVPMLICTVALWGAGLGGGYWIGLGSPDLGWLGLTTPLGPRGFWIAAIVSVSIGGLLVLAYFLTVSRKAIRRARAGRESLS